jgi:hypothetical protein
MNFLRLVYYYSTEVGYTFTLHGRFPLDLPTLVLRAQFCVAPALFIVEYFSFACTCVLVLYLYVLSSLSPAHSFANPVKQ